MIEVKKITLSATKIKPEVLYSHLHLLYCPHHLWNYSEHHSLTFSSSSSAGTSPTAKCDLPTGHVLLLLEWIPFCISTTSIIQRTNLKYSSLTSPWTPIVNSEERHEGPFPLAAPVGTQVDLFLIRRRKYVGYCVGGWFANTYLVSKSPT